MQKICILLIILFASCQSNNAYHKSRKKKVVLISVDGFRPEFYQDSRFNTPTLKKVAKEGFAAKAMESVFPSVTYPNHTTLISGKYPAEHGITSNVILDKKVGPTKEWYWNYKHVKTETLWSKLRKHNKKSAAIHWPVTLGAPIDYLVPEIFQTPPWYPEESPVLVKKYSTPGLPALINKKLNLRPYHNMKEADAWGAKAIKYIYETYRPDLSAFHIIYADKNQHETGRDSKQTKKAIEWIDQQLKPFISILDDKTCLLIVGDHGFMNYKKVIHINKLFVDRGWIKLDKKGKIKSWKVVAHKSGAQAGIYVKNKNLRNKVSKVLNQYSYLGYEVVYKKELYEMKTYPNAFAAISAKDGISFGLNYRGQLVKNLKQTKGQHGHLPNQKNLYTGLIAKNCNINAKDMPKIVKNTSIASIISTYLEIE